MHTSKYIREGISRWCFYNTIESIIVHDLSGLARSVGSQCDLIIDGPEPERITTPLQTLTAYFVYSKMTKWINEHSSTTTVEEALVAFLEFRKRANPLLSNYQFLQVFVDYKIDCPEAMSVMLLPIVDNVVITNPRSDLRIDHFENLFVDSLYITRKNHDGYRISTSKNVYMGVEYNSNGCDYDLIPVFKRFKNYKFIFRDGRELTFEDIENL